MKFLPLVGTYGTIRKPLANSKFYINWRADQCQRL